MPIYIHTYPCPIHSFNQYQNLLPPIHHCPSQNPTWHHLNIPHAATSAAASPTRAPSATVYSNTHPLHTATAATAYSNSDHPSASVHISSSPRYRRRCRPTRFLLTCCVDSWGWRSAFVGTYACRGWVGLGWRGGCCTSRGLGGGSFWWEVRGWDGV